MFPSAWPQSPVCLIKCNFLAIFQYWNQLPRCLRNLIIIGLLTACVALLLFLPGEQLVSDDSANSLGHINIAPFKDEVSTPMVTVLALFVDYGKILGILATGQSYPRGKVRVFCWTKANLPVAVSGRGEERNLHLHDSRLTVSTWLIFTLLGRVWCFMGSVRSLHSNCANCW